jgi:hypothetical protein
VGGGVLVLASSSESWQSILWKARSSEFQKGDKEKVHLHTQTHTDIDRVRHRDRHRGNERRIMKQVNTHQWYSRGPWLTHTPPAFRQLQMVSTYSNTTGAVSIKKQVTIPSHWPFMSDAP